jgi:hypothetical protein
VRLSYLSRKIKASLRVDDGFMAVFESSANVLRKADWCFTKKGPPLADGPLMMFSRRYAMRMSATAERVD